MKHTVVCLEWDESERGWGIRPDGCSLHLTEADMKTYVKAYWDGMPDSAPDEYTRPGGSKLIDVDEKTYQKIKNAPAKGIRMFQTDYRSLLSQRKEEEMPTKKEPSTSAKIADLEAQLTKLREQELNERRVRLWSMVSDLPQDDLQLLGNMIHTHFHGDGIDD